MPLVWPLRLNNCRWNHGGQSGWCGSHCRRSHRWAQRQHWVDTGIWPAGKKPRRTLTTSATAVHALAAVATSGGQRPLRPSFWRSRTPSSDCSTLTPAIGLSRGRAAETGRERQFADVGGRRSADRSCQWRPHGGRGLTRLVLAPRCPTELRAGLNCRWQKLSFLRLRTIYGARSMHARVALARACGKSARIS